MKKTFMDCSVIIKNNKLKIFEKNYKAYKLLHFKVDNNNEKLIKRIKGDYYVLKFDYVSLSKYYKLLKKEVVKILSKLMSNSSKNKILIVGLGNSSITCDSLGINTTKKVIATNHYNDFLTIPKVAVFNPEITEKTGINSFDLIKMVVNKLKPNYIIMIDSLATKNEDYLNNCIEINNTGIISSAAIKDNKKIDSNTFNIPLIAIGVPLILEKNKDLYTTPNVEEIVSLTSNIISEALNDLFF